MTFKALDFAKSTVRSRASRPSRVICSARSWAKKRDWGKPGFQDVNYQGNHTWNLQ
jgi:hypothetical protein